jgi:hypothetical protein
MRTLKTDIYQICEEVAAEFENWTFVSGAFKNKTLKHSDLCVSPGFYFKSDTTPFQPSVEISHKKSMKLFEKILGYNKVTSLVYFQTIGHPLQYFSEHLRCGASIYADKAFTISSSPNPESTIAKMIDLTESKPILRAMMKDGIAIIEKYYDLSSEENFLKNLPPKYKTRHSNSPYDEMDKQKGVMICIVRILLGDFDFVEYYRNDEYKTDFPKSIDDLDKIIAALPELKKRYAETGKVI